MEIHGGYESTKYYILQPKKKNVRLVFGNQNLFKCNIQQKMDQSSSSIKMPND